MQLAQQMSGINAVFYYSSSFFAQAHVGDPWFGSVLAAGVNVLATGSIPNMFSGHGSIAHVHKRGKRDA